MWTLSPETVSLNLVPIGEKTSPEGSRGVAIILLVDVPVDLKGYLAPSM